MREHHALRQAGRSGRVGEHDQIVRGTCHLLLQWRTGDAVDRGMVGGRSDRVDLADVRLLGCRGGGAREHRRGDEPGGAGVVELVVDLVRGVRRVDRRHDAAGQGDAVERHGVLGAVRRHDRHDLAWLEAGVQPPAGLGADRVVEFGVGERAPVRPVDECRLAGELVDPAEDERGEWCRRHLDRCQRAGEDHVRIVGPAREPLVSRCEPTGASVAPRSAWAPFGRSDHQAPSIGCGFPGSTSAGATPIQSASVAEVAVERHRGRHVAVVVEVGVRRRFADPRQCDRAGQQHRRRRAVVESAITVLLRPPTELARRRHEDPVGEAEGLDLAEERVERAVQVAP